MSVRNGPGIRQLTRTFGPNVWASPVVRLLIADLAAAYGTSALPGRIEEVELTLMIDPPSPACIRSPTRADIRNGPVRLTSMTFCQSFSLTSDNDG